MRKILQTAFYVICMRLVCFTDYDIISFFWNNLVWTTYYLKRFIVLWNSYLCIVVVVFNINKVPLFYTDCMALRHGPLDIQGRAVYRIEKNNCALEFFEKKNEPWKSVKKLSSDSMKKMVSCSLHLSTIGKRTRIW